MTRKMKEVPNRYIQSVFASGTFDGLDGEIIVGPATAEDVYRVTNSAVMSRDGSRISPTGCSTSGVRWCWVRGPSRVERKAWVWVLGPTDQRMATPRQGGHHILG